MAKVQAKSKTNKTKSTTTSIEEFQNKFVNIFEERKQLIKNILGDRIPLVPKTENQKTLIEYIKNPKVEMIFSSGSAGCGKTFLAIIESLNLLLGENSFTSIYIFKSVTPQQGEDIGFLPGSVEEKLAVALTSFYLQLEKFLRPDQIKLLKDQKIIKIFPLTGIRGISISKHDIVIVDEAQNLNTPLTKTVLTRMEESSKLIMIGDTTQKDTKNTVTNGLEFIVSKFEDVSDKIKIVRFTNEDVVRNELIKLILKIYEENSF
jgi:phosphate starvation-inducible PhoH-like protein